MTRLAMICSRPGCNDPAEYVKQSRTPLCKFHRQRRHADAQKRYLDKSPDRRAKHREYMREYNRRRRNDEGRRTQGGTAD